MRFDICDPFQKMKKVGVIPPYFWGISSTSGTKLQKKNLRTLTMKSIVGGCRWDTDQEGTVYLFGMMKMGYTDSQRAYTIIL